MRFDAEALRRGDLRTLARAATAVENRDPEALAELEELRQDVGHAIVVGITGAPGVGKSSLVDAMCRFLRQENCTVGVIAVDPSSHVSGGAILGDRIRMLAHHADRAVFIRSMATRGAVGGLARATADLALLMDVAGRDYVLIETVGVGQDEIEIASLAQVTVVVLAPNMGDDVQAIKAGVMEIADVFAINKADQPGAEKIEREIVNTPVVRTVAIEGKGIPELLQAVRQQYAARARQPRRQTTSALRLPQGEFLLRVNNADDARRQLEAQGARADGAGEVWLRIEEERN